MILALEISSSGKPWEVASLLKENRHTITPKESLLVSRAMRQLKLEKQLAAIPQRSDNSGPAGEIR